MVRVDVPGAILLLRGLCGATLRQSVWHGPRALAELVDVMSAVGVDLAGSSTLGKKSVIYHEVRTTAFGSSSHTVWVVAVMVMPNRVRLGLPCSYHQS